MKVLTAKSIEEEERVEIMTGSEKFYAFMDGFVLSPSNVYKMCWDAFSSCMYLISIYTVPLLLAFQMRLAGILFLVDKIVDYINLIDIVANFFTATVS